MSQLSTLPPSPSPQRWSVERRLAFVEQRLIWEGRINRADLVAQFGISPNQATADLRRFDVLHPQALVYDPRAKTYRAGAGLRAADDRDTGDLLRELRLIAEGVMAAGDGTLVAPPPLALAEAPMRRVEAATLRLVLGAIRDGRALETTYRSFSSNEPRRRRLAPHALVFDGFRWHVRARDLDEDRFKDFVIGRMSEAVVGATVAAEVDRDTEWSRKLTLTIAPHPELGPAGRQAIEMDYGMTDGQLRLECRAAVLWYVRRRLGLIPGHEKMAGHDQHIVLVSIDG